MKYFLIITFTLLSTILLAKEKKYPVNEIPDNLKENADAIIRNYTLTTEVTSSSESTSDVVFAVTIFNKGAQGMGDFIEHYDKTSSISNYSMNIYDSNGELLDKVKRSDFIDQSAYDGFSLYSDNRMIIKENNCDKYPYTIEYKFSSKTKQTLFIKSFFPVTNFKVAVEKSKFALVLTHENQVRIKMQNLPKINDSIFNNNKLYYEWNINNFQALKNEGYMPSFYQIVPYVYIAPNSFTYEGFKGDLTSWKTFGDWSWELIKNRDELSQTTINEIKELTAGLNSTNEKVKKVYKYLQENTRYVSIQLGIGGFQPFEPEMVEKTNYGDCKALTNYMRALLKAINIESNYVLIKAGKNAKYIDTDFAAQQMNHVILNVPNNGDTIWLECTSQRNPFGYLGNFTNDRFALEITNQGGKPVKTPAYKTHMNTQFRTITATINENGLLNCNTSTNYSGLQYENVDYMLYLDNEEQKKSIYKQVNLAGVKINNFNIEHKPDAIPKAKLDINMDISDYGQKNGNRLFIPLNILNTHTFIPKKLKGRNFNIQTSWTGYDADTVIFKIPDGYQPEFLPETIDINTPYGKYKTSTSHNNQEVIYIRELTLYADNFDLEEYDSFRNFFKKVVGYDNDKMVLIKN